MKKFIIALFAFFCVLFNVDATTYKDVVGPIVGNDSNKVTLYLFHSDSCRHCQNEKEYLEEIKDKYKDKIDIKMYELSDPTNSAYLKSVTEHFKDTSGYIPFTVIGDNYTVGFNDNTKEFITTFLDKYLFAEEVEPEKTITLPLLGKMEVKNVSIPIAAVVLGLVDGFNPCAMWILLFLINMLFNMKNKVKMWSLGIIFLLTSAFVYFLAMIGLNYALSFTEVALIKMAIGGIAIVGGALNLKSYIDTKNGGCHVVDEKKRKKYFTKIKTIINEKNFILAILGIMLLAFSVNAVELACSAGFPALFIEILNLNNIHNVKEILYILLYILFFLLDDLIVFIVAMATLQITGISTKYNRFSHLIGGILMILMGLLLIFKPEWLMFNF